MGDERRGAAVRSLGRALAFLTVLRVPPRWQSDGPWLGWAPLVGLGLGLAAACLMAGLRGLSHDPYQQLLSSALVVAALALATRGLHLDGLADTADALGAGSRQRGLAAMDDPRVGAFGVATVALVLVVQVAALWQVVAVERGTPGLLLAGAVSRLVLLFGARRGVPAARTGGLGASVVGSVPAAAPLAALLAVLTLAAAGGMVDAHGTPAEAAHLVTAALAGVAAALALRERCLHCFGGVTGDVLGAMVEVAFTATLVVCGYDLP